MRISFVNTKASMFSSYQRTFLSRSLKKVAPSLQLLDLSQKPYFSWNNSGSLSKRLMLLLLIFWYRSNRSRSQRLKYVDLIRGNHLEKEDTNVPQWCSSITLHPQTLFASNDKMTIIFHFFKIFLEWKNQGIAMPIWWRASFAAPLSPKVLHPSISS